MFLQVPFEFQPELQHIALIINTLLLIGALILLEFMYDNAPKVRRQHVRLLLPFLAILIGILLYAVYRQGMATV